jgi:glutamyl/glutaminyl-tRNA synthetase
MPTIRERISARGEWEEQLREGEYDFAVTTPAYDATLLLWKKDPSLDAVLPRLTHLQAVLGAMTTWTTETLTAKIMPYAETVGKGEVLWPLRVALSGRAQSPDPFTLMVALGKERTLDRLAFACAKITGDESAVKNH